MRDIKFRAWDTKQSKWCGYEDTGPVIDLHHSITHNCFMVDNDSYDFPHDLVLCQYTGLKDKNGVEIYEGDIVRFKNLRGYNLTKEVKWNNSGRYQGFGIGDSYMRDIEVIGNIYENPELLEE